MSHPAPVLVAVKERQPTVLAWALEMAARDGRPLRVVHTWVVDAPLPEYSRGALTADRLKEAGHAVLDEARTIVEASGLDVEVAYELMHGRALDVLKAESKDAAMVVVGTDAVSWWARILGEDVTHHLALRASCPVIVVPERSAHEQLTGGVMVTVEGNRPAEGPLRFAFEEAGRRGCGLHVVHAAHLGGPQDRETALKNVATVLAGWRDQYPDVEVSVVLEDGSPSDLAAAVTPLSQLFVVGRTRKAGSLVTLRRPVAAQSVRDARCPVAVVPSADPTS